MMSKEDVLTVEDALNSANGSASGSVRSQYPETDADHNVGGLQR